MHITNKLCLALTAGLIATAVAAEETNPFIGNWSGVWPNGQHNEFNVVAVSAEGQITAVYCAEQPNGFAFWFDIEPGGIESSIKRRGRVLHFARREDKMRYRFTLSRRRHPHLPIHPQGQALDARDVAARTIGVRRAHRATNARVSPSENLDRSRATNVRARSGPRSTTSRYHAR